MEVSMKPCACSGIRTCLLCVPKSIPAETHSSIYWHCPQCWNIFEGDLSRTLQAHLGISKCSSHDGKQNCTFIKLNGIKVYLDFISSEEEKYLVKEIDQCDWK